MKCSEPGKEKTGIRSSGLYNLPEESPYRTSVLVSGPETELPDGKRLPFDWAGFPVLPPGEKSLVHLRWQRDQITSNSTRFRITVGIDVRERKVVEVYLPESGRVLGCFDIRYAPALEPFEIVLDGADVEDIASEGVSLRMVAGTSPLWILYGGNENRTPAALQPHLFQVMDIDPVASFVNRMLSMASVQPFGWMEGCVLEGLQLLQSIAGKARSEAAIRSHMELFFRPDGQFVFENARSEPADGKIPGIEYTLPFATLARFEPGHPVLDKVVDFWLETRDSEGCVQDGETTSAEGSYTVAYPMAVVGSSTGRKDLIQLALHQLRLRRERLWTGEGFYLRYYTSDRRRTYYNWARGLAWYMLGLMHSLITLKRSDLPDDLLEECNRVSEWVITFQQSDGLWRCFLHEDGVLPDTSGSAGIAAALATGAEHGLLPSTMRTAAERTYVGLCDYLTPDGFLTGVAQSNRGGEELQRSNYRVISQMGMGLMAQLVGTLHK